MRGRANAVAAALVGGLLVLGAPLPAAAEQTTALVSVLAQRQPPPSATSGPSGSAPTSTPAPLTPEQQADAENRVTIAVIAVILFAIVFFGRKYRKKWGSS
ncbi:uncharacterized membrane protein YjfL (UPF0719 family) [Crossiella equi]|uniref:Uncharacterized membrane protein YjfL (UPF0719 family) n=1 Tax=Crossiella equi TaxID=130796 RepID=A0ABS5ADM9_9PSEU|nr:hypothetical protein [Crossiella equi]MBP2474679.1 uncharacterized membrane protein YjfL (UPF0719 family) [Crossiella equi]